MQRLISNFVQAHRLFQASPKSISSTIEIVKNPPRMTEYYAQACDGIFHEYGASMFPEDISSWSRGFSDFFTYMAIDQDNDRLVSCCIGGFDEESSTGEPLVTLGCFYTAPGYRGAGISKHVISQCFIQAKGYNTGGHGLLVRTENGTSCEHYARMGYGLLQPHVNLKTEIRVDDLALSEEKHNLVVKKLEEIDWNDVVAYDKTVSVREREKFMKLRLQPNDHTITMVAVEPHSREIRGLGCFRMTRTGDLQAGPFYCDNEAAAQALIKMVLSSVESDNKRKLIFHYPASNKSATRMFERIAKGELHSVPYTQQQFNWKLVHHDWERVYSLTDTTLSLV